MASDSLPFSTDEITAGLRRHMPALDGLRGLAIAAVVLYHCQALLNFPAVRGVVAWGWAGVNLFFVLSGFLITGILLDSREKPHYFKNFYGRRLLRIWPVYVLLLLVYYLGLPLVFRDFHALGQIRTAPWLLYVLLVQNLSTMPLPGPLVPTWSLAIEEQFYLLWAPAVRLLRHRGLLVALAIVFITSPLVRMSGIFRGIPTHTLMHLDGLALGSLLALALRLWPTSARRWRLIAGVLLTISLAGAVAVAYNRTLAFIDTYLALGFGGLLLLSVLGPDATLLKRALTWRPLRFLGKISYGLYMFHILCFVAMGSLDRHLLNKGPWGGLALLCVRLVVAVGFATLLWYGFESRILRLKRHFSDKGGTASSPSGRPLPLVAGTFSSENVKPPIPGSSPARGGLPSGFRGPPPAISSRREDSVARSYGRASAPRAASARDAMAEAADLAPARELAKFDVEVSGAVKLSVEDAEA